MPKSRDKKGEVPSRSSKEALKMRLGTTYSGSGKLKPIQVLVSTMNEQSKSVSRQNVLEIPFSPAQMSTEKRYKQIKMKEIISAVCALLNSNGGELRLEFDKNTGNEVGLDVIDDCIRMIKQWFIGIIGVTKMASRIKLSVKPHEIRIEIQESVKLITVNYNLYLPSKSQVLAVPPTEPPEAIKNILQRQRNIVEREDVPIGSHLKTFKKDQNTAGLVEDSDTQFKNLKTAPTKHVTLADRITGKGNKLTSYVSGFANYRGGHIYYGINDEGVVEGEIINEKEKDEIIKKVAKTINKMIWPQNSSPPQRGEQWDIFFEPVHDENCHVIPSTFVIVLYIVPCPGGVFVDEPESYHLVEGKVRKIRFQEWWRKFTGVWRRDGELCSVSTQVSRVAWSSEKSSTLFRKLSQTLVQHRNDDDMKAFEMLSKLAKERFPESDVELIIMAQEIPASYKPNHFQKAMSSLEKFAELLKSSKDSSIFEVRMLQLKSMHERSEGNYEKSYQLTQCGLQKMESTPVEVHTVLFYIEAAMIETIMMATSEQDSKSYRSLKDSALKCMLLATTTAKSLEDEDHPFEMSDLKQKMHIYKAWVLLECAITGDINVVHQKRATGCTYEDIQAATRELACVSLGTPLSCFRQIQYHLAECDLFRRCSEVLNEDYVSNLKKAFECASRARDLARKHRFENIINYANKRLADLTEKLVRYAVQTRGKLPSRNFLGIEY